MMQPDEVRNDRAKVDSGKCPECGTDLTRTDATHHANLCLPQGAELAKPTSDHARRYRLLLNYSKAHPARPTDAMETD